MARRGAGPKNIDMNNECIGEARASRKSEPLSAIESYAAHHVKEKFAIDLPLAMTIARLAGLGEEGARQ